MPSLAPKSIRGVIFDLWNTLAFNDYRPNPIVALGDAFHLRGQPGWTKILERGMMLEPFVGIEDGLAAISRRTGIRLDPGTLADLSRLWREACGRTRLFPDVQEVLPGLAERYRLGLLSNTQSFDLDFLDTAPLPWRARLFSYEAGALKPDRSLFLRMADLLELEPPQLLMVGDNLTDDVLGAEAAGMQALLIRRRNADLSFQEPSPDREPLANLSQLAAILSP